MNVSKKRNGRERGGHTLDEVDGVLPSPPFQDVAVGGLGDLASASHRRVEPSMSVNKNVTTPEGAAARSADTPAESHNRYAPTWHFAGIRPRRVTKTHLTATRNVPRQQHVVVEDVYRPVDEPDPVGHGGDPECAHCLGAGSDYRPRDPDHQAIDEERQRASRPQSGQGGRKVDARGGWTGGRGRAPRARAGRSGGRPTRAAS